MFVRKPLRVVSPSAIDGDGVSTLDHASNSSASNKSVVDGVKGNEITTWSGLTVWRKARSSALVVP